MPCGQLYNPGDDLGKRRNPNAEDAERGAAMMRLPRSIHTPTSGR